MYCFSWNLFSLFKATEFKYYSFLRLYSSYSCFFFNFYYSCFSIFWFIDFWYSSLNYSFCTWSILFRCFLFVFGSGIRVTQMMMLVENCSCLGWTFYLFYFLYFYIINTLIFMLKFTNKSIHIKMPSLSHWVSTVIFGNCEFCGWATAVGWSVSMAWLKFIYFLCELISLVYQITVLFLALT